jgi:hypothetical protein
MTRNAANGTIIAAVITAAGAIIAAFLSKPGTDFLNVRIKGTVEDACTSDNLSGATVTFMGKTAPTGSNGDFELEYPRHGITNWWVKVTAVHYKPTNLLIVEGDRAKDTIDLSRTRVSPPGECR